VQLGLAAALAACATQAPVATPSTGIPATPASAAESPSPCATVDSPFAGIICVPAASGRHPAVVLFGGYGGDGEARRFARELSTRGFVTAAISYFGAPGTPKTLVDVPVEIGVSAVRAIAARPDVDPARLAVFGTSKGGEYAFLVAAEAPEVKAVIANVPSPFAWYGLGVHGAPTGCSWSRGKQPLPCVPEDVAAGQGVWRQMAAGHPVGFRDAYDAAARNRSAVERAFFPIERVAGPILCLAAGDDRVWNSPAQCEEAIAYLRARGHRFAAADRALTFPGAGHLYLLARAGASAAMNFAPMGQGRMAFGGTPEADARAARAAIPAIIEFLAVLAHR